MCAPAFLRLACVLFPDIRSQSQPAFALRRLADLATPPSPRHGLRPGRRPVFKYEKPRTFCGRLAGGCGWLRLAAYLTPIFECDDDPRKGTVSNGQMLTGGGYRQGLIERAPYPVIVMFLATVFS
jgi:hypothetical protein